MGIFDRFPYSSTHEMNLDFMLGKATEIAESLQEIDTHKEQAEQAATNAAQSATSAAQSATSAAEQYQSARGAAIRAEVAQGNAENAATNAGDAADRAEAASDRADEAVEQAQAAATQAQTAATNAGTAADGAIASAAAAETRINNLAASLPKDFTELNNEVTDLKSAFDDTTGSLKNSKINTVYVPSITWVNNNLNSTDGEIGASERKRATTQEKIDVSGYNRVSWNAYDVTNNNGANIAFYNKEGAFIEAKYVSNPPYDILDTNVAKIRLGFGSASDINVSSIGNIIALAHTDTDDTELLPLYGSRKTIMLIGDSITQGVGSTGFVSYNIDIGGVTYSVRGNGPDYPDAGTGYKVGTFLYEADRRKWYEALSGNGWAQKLKSYYEKKFGCSVLNYGMSGIDSSNLSGFIGTLVVNSNADIVVMMIGTNDRGNNTKLAFFTNVYKAACKIIESGKKLIIIASIPASVTNESLYTYHMEDVEHILYKIAKLLNCKFISLYELFMDYCDLKGVTIDSLLADGLHPSDAGYEVMFELITKELGLNRKRPGATW